MAYIRQQRGKWRAEIETGGVRTSRSFSTEDEALSWASKEEARIRETAQRRMEADAMLASKAYAALLSRLPKRLVDAALASPFTHDEIVSQAVPRGLMSGVYFLVHNGQVVYVGQSKNVFHRLARHVRDGREFDAFNILPCAEDRLDEVEELYITAFLPGMNNSFGRARKSA